MEKQNEVESNLQTCIVAQAQKSKELVRMLTDLQAIHKSYEEVFQMIGETIKNQNQILTQVTELVKTNIQRPKKRKRSNVIDIVERG